MRLLLSQNVAIDMTIAHFEILGGKDQGHVLVFHGSHHRLEIKHKDETLFMDVMPLVNVESFELITSQEFKASDTAVLGTLGLVVAGPIGAAAGAGISRMSRECTFLVIMKNGDRYICKGWRNHYNEMLNTYAVAKADPKTSLAIAESDRPTDEELQQNRIAGENVVPRIPLVWQWSFLIFVIIYGFYVLG